MLSIVGVLQYEAKLLLRHCIKKKYFSYQQLSDITESMELGYMEYSNKPTVITKRIIQSNDNRLSQNGKVQLKYSFLSFYIYIILLLASQMWLLGRVLPFLFGKFVPESNKCWLNYLLMLEISDFLLAADITRDDVGYLESLISTHHRNFMKIYPDQTVTPKMHYLIHTLRLILE